MKSKSKLGSHLFIMLGSLIASFSVACILLPNDAIDYGTAGIAIMISKFTGINLTLCVQVVLLPFLIAGFVTLGKDFFLRSLDGCLVYSLGLALFEKIPFELNTEHFIAVIFGGALLGLGLSMILRAGGTIDGSEILANIFVNRVARKMNLNVSMTGFLIMFNACVYAAAFMLMSQTSALLSLLVYVVASFVIDHFTNRFQAIKQVVIITKNPDEIVRYLKDKMNKTCTVIDSQGAIAGNNKTLICYVTYFELQAVRELVEKYKNQAFITVSTVDEIIR